MSEIPPDHPALRSEDVHLPSGGSLLVRPMQPEDVDAARQLFASLSPETIYLRFLAPLRSLSQERLGEAVSSDRVSTVSLGAWLRSGAQPLLTAVGRYRRLPGDDDAECGVLVGDALRSQGIGAMLLRRLVAAARAQGIRNLVGYVDPYNLRLLRMIARAGFSCRQHLEEHLLRVSVPVPEEADSPAESVK